MQITYLIKHLYPKYIKNSQIATPLEMSNRFGHCIKIYTNEQQTHGKMIIYLFFNDVAILFYFVARCYFLFFLFFNIFYCCSSTVFHLFPPITPQHPSPLHILHLFPLPCFVIVRMYFIIVPVNPPPFPPIIPSSFPSRHCQPVLNFNVFGYILLPCSFC